MTPVLCVVDVPRLGPCGIPAIGRCARLDCQQSFCGSHGHGDICLDCSNPRGMCFCGDETRTFCTVCAEAYCHKHVGAYQRCSQCVAEESRVQERYVASKEEERVVREFQEGMRRVAHRGSARFETTTGGTVDAWFYDEDDYEYGSTQNHYYIGADGLTTYTWTVVRREKRLFRDDEPIFGLHQSGAASANDVGHQHKLIDIASKNGVQIRPRNQHWLAEGAEAERAVRQEHGTLRPLAG